MRGGLTLRLAVVSGLLAVIVAAVFVVLLVAIEDQRDSGRRAVDVRQELAAADGLEKLVIDMETGVRGYVITRERRFLEPWTAARAAFPDNARAFIDLVQDPGQKQLGRRITRDAATYASDYTVRVVNAVTQDAASARSVAVTAEGKRRVDALRAQFDSFAARERAVVTARQDQVNHDSDRAIVIGVVGLAGSVALIVLMATYLTRAVGRPIRRASSMASRLAGGDLAVRMPETGAGEIGELEHSFNVLAGSLEQNRAEFQRLADEQAALRRVATLVAQAVSPTEVFEMVTREVGLLCDADFARMERYEPDGRVTGVADWSRSDDRLMVGTTIALEGVSIAAQVRDARRPVRVDSFIDAPGPIAEEARALGIRSSVGCPIVVEGRLWGVIAASTKRDAPFPRGTEAQIGEFTELVATAVANAQSHDELLASRARIVTAADQARRRIERDLHDGAQQRLVHAVITLRMARRALQDGGQAEDLVGEALDHAERATSELRELAHGILPSVLTRGGLQAGVEALASRISLPVTVEVTDERLLPAVEAAAYFIVSEGLTNAAKHSRADRAFVKADVEDGELRIELRDDGVGGATLANGTGLLGLHDRVAAFQGRLEVDSPPGAGTRIVAILPVLGDEA